MGPLCERDIGVFRLCKMRQPNELINTIEFSLSGPNDLPVELRIVKTVSVHKRGLQSLTLYDWRHIYSFQCWCLRKHAGFMHLQLKHQIVAILSNCQWHWHVYIMKLKMFSFYIQEYFLIETRHPTYNNQVTNTIFATKKVIEFIIYVSRIWCLSLENNF